MTPSYPKCLKMISKPTRLLDYAIMKFTSSTPSLDNAIIKLWRTHTRHWHAPFPTEHAGIILVTLRRKMAELWICEVCFYSYIAKLIVIYYVILSQISK